MSTTNAERRCAELEQILENMPDMFYRTDAAGIVLYCNRAVTRVLGYPLDEIVGQPVSKIYADPAERQRVVETILAAGGEFIRVEAWVKHRDGTLRRASTQARALYDGAGKFAGIEGSGRDVTESFATVLALRKSESLLRLEHAVTKCLACADSASIATREVIRYLCETEDWTLGSYWRVDAGEGVLRFEDHWCVAGFDSSQYLRVSRQTQFAPGTGMVGRAWASGGALWSENAMCDERIVQREVLRGHLGSVFAFPVFAEGQVVGVFAFFSRAIRRPDDRLVEAARAIGDQLGQFLQRKRTEEALRESQDQFRKLVDNSPLAIAQVDPSGAIEYINRRAVEMFGYLPEDIPAMDRWWVQAYPDEAYRAQVVAQWMGLVMQARTAGGDIESREYRVTCKDGGVKIVAIFGAWVEDKVLVLFDDVTERRRAEREIAQALDRFRFLAESARVFAWVRDVDKGTLNYLTPYEPLLGPLPNSGRNSMFRDLVHPDDLGKYDATIARAVATLTEYELELRILRGDGEMRWLLIRAKCYRDAPGGSTTLAGVTIDITDRKRAENAMRELNQDLERRVRARTAELTQANEALNAEIGVRREAEASALNLTTRVKNLTRRLWEAQEAERRWLAAELHDGVCGSLVGLGLNVAVADKQLAEGDLHGARARLDDIAAQVEDVQLLARNIALVDLRPLLEEGKDLVLTLGYFADSFAKRSGIAVTVDVEDPFSEERLKVTDKIALYRIVQEALTNCAKHASPTQVVIGLSADASGIEMSIADDGVGFDIALLDDSTRGLGLLSMQERAESIGGIWSVESAPGEGARISVRLEVAGAP